MANTLTNLIPDMYAALDVVSREMVGLIPAITMDATDGRAALNEIVRSPVVPSASATDITPGVTPPNDGDQAIGNAALTITKSRTVPIKYNGEERQGLNNGPGFLTVRANQFLQAMRTLTNEVEADLAALYKSAARAYGIAGTTPFATAGDYTDIAQVRKILVDNGAPIADLQLVVDTSAGAVFRGKQSQAQMQGDQGLIRQGVLLDMHGMAIRESAQIKNVVKGSGAGYLVNNVSGYAVGASTLAADTGSGTMLAGDVITFAGDLNKYVVGSALSAGSLAINAPGLRQALADNVAITIGNNYTANLAFSRDAIALVTRAPALPEEGDLAVDRMLVTDPVSGLTFEIAVYPGYRQVRYEVSLAWGAACVKPNHLAILLG